MIILGVEIAPKNGIYFVSGNTKQNTNFRVSTKLLRGEGRTQRKEWKIRWIYSSATIWFLFFFWLDGAATQNPIGTFLHSWKCRNKSDHFVRHHPSHTNDRTWKFHFNRIWKRMSCKFARHTQNYRSINVHVKHFVSIHGIRNWFRIIKWLASLVPTDRPAEKTQQQHPIKFEC